MSTESAPRRVALVLARHSAAPATPPGIDPDTFATACLADAYEVLADLIEVRSGIAGPPEVEELLWPGAVRFPADIGTRDLAARLAAEYDELVVIPADAPDLPGLVLAKLFKVLHRVDLAVAPERGGSAAVALGLALPLAPWIPDEGLDLDRLRYPALAAQAPSRSRVALAPDWHRLRTTADLRHLDPGLEGWEETRALLAGTALGASTMADGIPG
jgi:hypothetical protein